MSAQRREQNGRNLSADGLPQIEQGLLRGLSARSDMALIWWAAAAPPAPNPEKWEPVFGKDHAI
jgi:hypothetical protein